MIGSFRRQHYATDDPDEGHAWLCQAYSDFDLLVHATGEDFRFDADALSIGSSVLSVARHSMSADARSGDGLEHQVFVYCRLPTTTMETSHRQLRLGAGDAVSIRPLTPYRTVWRALDAVAVTIDPDQLADVAAQLTGSTRRVEFAFDNAVSPIAAAHWIQVCSLVSRVGRANVANGDGVLLADELTRLLATTALNCFANTSTADLDVVPTRTAPASLARAIAFVDANLDRPIRLRDLAEAARVNPRALNLTFQRYHQVSPMGYVRRARLDRAHRDLVAAQPGDGQTVTSIAARWGFFSLPRFGVTYRRSYGRPPSQTLRRA